MAEQRYVKSFKNIEDYKVYNAQNNPIMGDPHLAFIEDSEQVIFNAPSEENTFYDDLAEVKEVAQNALDGTTLAVEYSDDKVTVKAENVANTAEHSFEIGVATTEQCGLMSKEDKIELYDNSVKAGIIGDYTDAPARTNLINDNVLDLSGYRISLKGMYDQGVRSITFKGCAFTETSTVVAGLIVNSDGKVESYIPYDGTAPQIYTLPLTSESDWFWGTYRTEGGGITAWKPTHVFFNSPIVEDLKKRTALLDGIDVDVVRIDGRLGNVENAISVATDYKDKDLYILNGIQEGSVVTADKDIVIVGRNILDNSTLKNNVIINDSGVEVSDTVSSYYAYYIPVVPGQSLTASFHIEKFYKYRKNKEFIGRTSGEIPASTPFTIPEDTYWIMLQINKYDGYRMLVYGNEVGRLEPFRTNTENKAYSSMSIYTQDRSVVGVTVNQYFNALSYSEKMATLTTKVTDIEASLKGIDLSVDGYIISVSEEIASKLISLQMPEGCKIIGDNIFNVDTAKHFYIKNDNGEEIVDPSSYYTQYIPCAGKGIVANFTIQRLYLYDSSKNFIERTGSLNAGSVYVAPAGVHYVQVQVTEDSFTKSDKVMIYYGQGDVNKYTPYEEYTEAPNKAFSIYKEDASLLSITMTVSAKHVFPEIGVYNYWEPTEATDDYACHQLGRDNQSVEGLTYESLLNEYFDVYVNKKYSDGYKVIKKGLGNDSGNSKENPLGNEIFTYEFTPTRYNHTVLLSAGMNASELSGIFGIAYFIKALMEHDEDGMKALYNTTRFIVLPCLCPSSLNLSPIKYHNFNTVRINKNFNYKGSWAKVKEDVPGEAVGAYPDSETETVLLKRWINSYSCSDLWIDCHSDTASEGYSNMMTQVICSDDDTVGKVQLYFDAMKQFYVDKGYIAADMTVRQEAWVTSISGYPKTLYSKEVCGTPAIMIEQYISSTTYGSDGMTNNDSYGIKNYASLIRAYTLAFCRSGIEIID